MPRKPAAVAAKPKRARTSEGLRDILFDEIEELRTGNGDPTKSLAVAHLARQIVNTAKVEIEFQRHLQNSKAEGGAGELGSLRLGQG
jgi:hypothetical protein